MKNHTTCLVCSGSNMGIVYEAPLMPLGAQLIGQEDIFKPELFYPLHYALCYDCSTFQSVESVPEDILRSENKYVSATSATVTQRDHDLFEEVTKYCNLGSGAFIVEIGGSDGIFLQNFLGKDFRIINIEPVREVGDIARRKGIETISEFLVEDIADTVVARERKADLIIAKQVLENVPDLHRFVKSAALMLSANGRMMMEVPYVKDLLDGNFYDLLAHLRKYHFSLTSLVRLFSMHGLAIEKVIRYSSLGGGFRFYAGWKDDVKTSGSIEELINEEQQWGVFEPSYYLQKFNRGLGLKRDLLNIVERIKGEGKSIVGFGAGIKASALLNYCGLDDRYIKYLVDNGLHKQGKLMPGVRLPIVSPEKIDDSVDYILVLAWLHQDEIIRSFQPFVDRGGKFIIPTPEVRVLEAGLK